MVALAPALKKETDVLAVAGEIVNGEFARHVDDYERRGEYPRWALWRLGEAGLLETPFALNGDIERPFETYVQLIELISRKWVAVAESVNVHLLSAYGIAKYGTSTQKADFLPGMLSGRILGSNCLSEPEAGSDLPAIALEATRTPAGYRLNGAKLWVTHIGIADCYTVYCRTGGSGAPGISSVIVDAKSRGLRCDHVDQKMGFRALPTGKLVFDDVDVSAASLVGREGRAFLIAGEAMDLGKLGVAACALGLAQAALDYSAGYARSRRQFGEPIMAFQGVSFLLADMAANIAAARSLALAAARRCDSGRPASTEIAMAKLLATEIAMKATTDAVQILGGEGYTDRHPVERWMREAKLLQIIGGTSQIQRVVISRAL